MRSKQGQEKSQKKKKKHADIVAGTKAISM